MQLPYSISLERFALTDTNFQTLRLQWVTLASARMAFVSMGADDIAETSLASIGRGGLGIVATLERSGSMPISPREEGCVVGGMLFTEANVGPRRFYEPSTPRPLVKSMIVDLGATANFRRVIPSCRNGEKTVTLEAEIGLNLAHALINAQQKRRLRLAGPPTYARYGPQTWVDTRAIKYSTDPRQHLAQAIWKELGSSATLVDRAGKEHHSIGDIRTWYAQNRLEKLATYTDLRLASTRD